MHARDQRPPASRREPAGRRVRRRIGRLLRALLYSVLFAVGVAAGIVTAAFPHLHALETRAESRESPGVILARDNHTQLRRLRAPTSRTYVSEAQVPAVLARAVVAAEDRRFYEHGGVDPRGLLRALAADLRARSAVQGGSTITQQLVKNAYVGPNRSIGRKTREAALAIALETRWSKQRILTAYLNTAYFGDGHYGVYDAARGYFGVPVGKLRIDQAALLASLLRAPEGNSPSTSPAHARAARDRVLTNLVETGDITPAAAAYAQSRPLPTKAALARRRGFAAIELAPQFSDAVVTRLIARYGVRRALSAGLRVRTTLDAPLQRAATEAVRRAADVGLDAAIVAIDPKSGEVRVMVNGGSSARSAFNVALDGHRQPGSAFKPFMLAAAYKAGATPKSRVESGPFSKTYPDGTTFTVKNDGGYAGPTTIEHGTWKSDNTVYARLQDRYGIQAAIDEARAAGIRSAIDPVPAAVLGALPEGTTPTELAHAYATFDNHGARIAMTAGGGPRLIQKVGEHDTGATWRPTAVSRQTIPRDVADRVTSTLEGVVQQGTGTRAGIGRPAAGKTGTTEDYRDAWFVGYTPTLVAAVWVGHAEGGIPMRTENGGGPVVGGSIPAAIWHDFMRAATDGTPVANFDLELPSFTLVTIDPANGLLAGPWCAGAVATQVLAGHEPTETSTTCATRTRPTPDVTGQSEADARATLESDAFTVAPDTTSELVADPTLTGTVIRQQPTPGTPIGPDDPIQLVIGEAVLEP